MRTRLRRESMAGRDSRRIRLRAMSPLAFLLLLTSVPAPPTFAAEDLANLVVNGSFEQPAIADRTFVHVGSIDGWTPDASGAPIEVQRGVRGTPGEGAQLVELDSNRAGGIQQTLATKPGQRYLLSFLASPRPNLKPAAQNRVEVIWDGKPIDVPFELGEGAQDTDWTPIYRVVPATGPQTTLVFRDAGTPSDSLGPYIDDVAVSEVADDATTQPEGIPGIEVVTTDTADDGVPDKEAFAACPRGKTPIGGGAQVLGNIGHVFLKGSQRADETGWAAQAGALGGNPWHLRAQAICVPASVARARELQVVTADSAENAEPTKEVSATCPPGKWAIGGGAQVVGNPSGVFLQRSVRDRENRWSARAEDLSREQSWQLRAQVVCVPRSVALSSGLQVVTGDSAEDTAADKPAAAACAAGKLVTAGGAQVLGNIDRVFVQWTLPEGDGGWLALAESRDDPAKAPWRVRAQAICLSSLAALPPNAVDDAFSPVEDLPLPQGRPGVLGNDTDPGGESLTAELAAGPAHGSVRLRPDGSFTYTPAANYNGPDAFTYRARNRSGLTSAIATVSLTVSGTNDSPAAEDDTAATPLGIPVTVPVTANDEDVDGDALTAKVRSDPASGTITCSGGSCTYTPEGGFTGRDTFTYTAEDGRGGSDDARVAVTVAPPGTPVAVDDDATTFEGTPVRLPVLANDVPGDPPTAVSATPPSQGTLVPGQDNVFTFTPAAGFQGRVEFPYTITDADGQTSNARVRIDVVPPQVLGEEEVPPGGEPGPGAPGVTDTTDTTIPGAGGETTTTTSEVAVGPNLEDGGNTRRSVFSRAVTPPTEIPLDLNTIAAHTAVAGLLIVLIGFPADLFNKAIEENYDQLRARFRRIPGVSALLDASTSALSFVVFLAVAAVLYGLLDPGFGFNQSGLVLVVGLFVAIVVSTLAFELPIGFYTRRVAREECFIRTYPGILAVAVVCVVFSRLAQFHPGYCYGLIAGYAMARGRQLSPADDGRSVTIATLCLLAVSLVAWFAWIPVAAAAETSTGVGLLIADAALSTTFVMGVEGLLFALIPLQFLDGSKLARWRRPLWLLLYGTVVLVFVHTVLDPKAQYLRASERGALAGALFLFFAFGSLSLVVWAYVRRLSRRGDPAPVP